MREHPFTDSQFNDPDYDPYDPGDFEPNLVFVIMSFAEEMRQVYSTIKDECKKLALNTQRADEMAGSGIVLRDITNLIERAEFIICDLTDESPNVYYELGYAHGVDNEALDIILIAKDGASLHFNIAPLRVHYYRSIPDLRLIISSNLKQMIRMTR